MRGLSSTLKHESCVLSDIQLKGNNIQAAGKLPHTGNLFASPYVHCDHPLRNDRSCSLGMWCAFALSCVQHVLRVAMFSSILGWRWCDCPSTLFSHLCHCHAGSVELASALEVNVSLKVLELQSNQIGPSGCSALCQALRLNHSVHALNFNDNELGDDGAEAVGELLLCEPFMLLPPYSCLLCCA